MIIAGNLLFRYEFPIWQLQEGMLGKRYADNTFNGYNSTKLLHRRINDYWLKVSIMVFRSGPLPKAFFVRASQ
jgi:hypothetical protein